SELTCAHRFELALEPLAHRGACENGFPLCPVPVLKFESLNATSAGFGNSHALNGQAPSEIGRDPRLPGSAVGGPTRLRVIIERHLRTILVNPVQEHI